MNYIKCYLLCWRIPFAVVELLAVGDHGLGSDSDRVGVMIVESQGTALVEMRGVSKAFPGVKALDDVSFDLRRGEVHVLLGENGAGKSTLIKILAGAYQMDSGTILLDGREVRITSPRVAQQLGISTIHQELNLIPGLRVADNVLLGREPMRVRSMGLLDERRMRELAAGLLSQLGVDIDPTAKVRELGIAQRQMVEIARALSFDARVVIMDEPTAALSEKEVDTLFDTIGLLKSRGVGIIYITHRLEELNRVGDRVTVLRDGKRMDTLPIAEASLDRLIKLMVGRDVSTRGFREKVAPGPEVLRVVGLGRKGVFHDISFSLRRGEIVGLAGLMGAGRTELARAIFGRDRIDSGEVILHGERVSVKSPREAIRHGLGLLPEDRKTQGLMLSLSLRHNIVLTALARMPRGFIIRLDREADLAREWVGRLNIRPPLLGRRVLHLSGGNQQKVVLAKWLCAQCDLLVFDEPTRGIDVGAKAEVYELMNDLTKQGVAILMISSDLPEILGMSDRILVMREGMLVAEYQAGAVDQERILKDMMGSRSA